MKMARTYQDWNSTRLTGRGGKKKVRRDTELSLCNNGLLEFRYTGYKNKSSELLATLAPDNTYTFYWDDKQRYYPTFSNIFMIVARVVVYRDMSHYKNYAQPLRITAGGSGNGRYQKTESGWERVETMPFVSGLQYRDGVCLNPQIAVDYKRVLNREKSLPWLRKTETLAKVLRVAVRLGILDREQGRNGFSNINLDEPTAADAQIILNMGNAVGLWGWSRPEGRPAALMRAANNGLADFREWLYTKHGCYEMLPVETKGEEA
jgi:hypothetical protein